MESDLKITSKIIVVRVIIELLIAITVNMKSYNKIMPSKLESEYQYDKDAQCMRRKQKQSMNFQHGGKADSIHTVLQWRNFIGMGLWNYEYNHFTYSYSIISYDYCT